MTRLFTSRKTPGHFIIFGLMLTIGLINLSQGGYLKAKAMLAQYLLDDAWAKSVADGGTVKPWPWADTWPVARITVPDLDVDLVVLEGASGQALAFGPDRVETLAKLGAPGTAVIAGHRDSHFAFLEDIRQGHDIWLETRDGKKHRYAVMGMQAIETATVTLNHSEDTSRLVLVTCYPFDGMVAGSEPRYLVFAERADGIV